MPSASKAAVFSWLPYFCQISQLSNLSIIFDSSIALGKHEVKLVHPFCVFPVLYIPITTSYFEVIIGICLGYCNSPCPYIQAAH